MYLRAEPSTVMAAPEPLSRSFKIYQKFFYLARFLFTQKKPATLPVFPHPFDSLKCKQRYTCFSHNITRIPVWQGMTISAMSASHAGRCAAAHTSAPANGLLFVTFVIGQKFGHVVCFISPRFIHFSFSASNFDFVIKFHFSYNSTINRQSCFYIETALIF